MWPSIDAGGARLRLIVIQPVEGEVVTLAPRRAADPNITEGRARVRGNVGLQATDAVSIGGATGTRGGSATLEAAIKLKIGIELAAAAAAGLASDDGSVQLRPVEVQAQFAAQHRDTRLCLRFGSVTTPQLEAATGAAAESDYCLVLLDAADAEVPVRVARAALSAAGPPLGADTDADREVLLHAFAVDVMGAVIASARQRIVLRAPLPGARDHEPAQGGRGATEQERDSATGASAGLRKRAAKHVRAIVDGREAALPLPSLPCARSPAADAIAVAHGFCSLHAVSQGDCADLQRVLLQQMRAHCEV